MPKHIVVSLFLSLILCLDTASANFRTEAERVYQKARPAVFQIKTAVSASAPKSSYGTGFAISEDGRLITNFHVIASSLHKDKDYKLFLVDGEDNLPVTVLAVDVVNDLALIKVNRTFKAFFKLATFMPKQGEKIYPIGLPEDLNMSLTEGLYNEILDHGPYRKIHMSAPLNGGMSGGPTVNGKGEVVGVNVSVKIFSQNLSFAVPVQFVRDIIAKAIVQDSATTDEAIHKDIQNQLLAVDSKLIASYIDSLGEKEDLDGWQIPKAPKMLKCWQQDRNHAKKRYLSNSKRCYLQGGAYLHNWNYAGTFSLDFRTYKSAKMNSWQLFRVANRFGGYSGSMGTGSYLETKFKCENRRVQNVHKINVLVNYCISGYVDYPELRTVYIDAFAINERNEMISMQLDFDGLAKGSVTRLMEAAINSIEPTTK